jgi:hypothetical protein
MTGEQWRAADKEGRDHAALAWRITHAAIEDIARVKRMNVAGFARTPLSAAGYIDKWFDACEAELRRLHPQLSRT